MTENEILAAQQTWGDGVVHIGAASDWQTAHERATTFVKQMYMTDGTLLFAPTKASQQQFRPTLKSAVSYFVGQDAAYPEDKGFALEPWVNVRFENAGIQIDAGGVGFAMGNYFFQTADGVETKVEYTFGYKRFKDGLKIILHHSALPFNP